jgi:Putative transposase
MVGEDDFFRPLNVLARVFRGQFVWYMKKAYHAGALKGVGQDAHRKVPIAYQTRLDRLYQQVWVVQAKRLCGGPNRSLRLWAPSRIAWPSPTTGS